MALARLCDQRLRASISIHHYSLVLIILAFALFLAGFSWPGLIAVLTKRSLMTTKMGLFTVAIVWGLANVGLRYCRIPFARPTESRGREQDQEQSETSLFGGRRSVSRVVSLATIIAMVMLIALLLAGYPRGFEVTAYHLPIAINIFHDRSLTLWDHAYMHAFPANMALWSGFWLQWMPERLVSIDNLPFLSILGYAVFILARQVGSDRQSSILMVAGIISVPVFGFSAMELGSDVAGVAFLVAAVAVALGSPKKAYGLAFVSGLAVGIAFGFKPLHLVGGGLLGLLILFGFAREAETDGRPWGSMDIGRATAFGAGFLLLATPWLLRNWWVFGNPLYPVHIDPLFDLLGFPAAQDFSPTQRMATQFEWVRTPSEWFVYPWVEWQYIGQNFKHSSGFGAFFASTVPIAWLTWLALIAVSLARRFLERKPFVSLRRIGAGIVCLIIGSGITLVWALLADRQPRYVMGGIPLLMVLYGPLLTWAAPRWRITASVSIGAAALVMNAILVISLAAANGRPLIGLRLPSRAEYYEYPQQIDRLPTDSVVANLAGRPWHYALFGARLSNRVVPSTLMDTMAVPGNRGWLVSAKAMGQLKLAYLFSEEPLAVEAGGCYRLEEADALRLNPENRLKLPAPRILYRIVGNCSNKDLIISKITGK